MGSLHTQSIRQHRRQALGIEPARHAPRRTLERDVVTAKASSPSMQSAVALAAAAPTGASHELDDVELIRFYLNLGEAARQSSSTAHNAVTSDHGSRDLLILVTSAGAAFSGAVACVEQWAPALMVIAVTTCLGLAGAAVSHRRESERLAGCIERVREALERVPIALSTVAANAAENAVAGSTAPTAVVNRRAFYQMTERYKVVDPTASPMQERLINLASAVAKLSGKGFVGDRSEQAIIDQLRGLPQGIRRSIADQVRAQLFEQSGETFERHYTMAYGCPDTADLDFTAALGALCSVPFQRRTSSGFTEIVPGHRYKDDTNGTYLYLGAGYGQNEVGNTFRVQGLNQPDHVSSARRLWERWT